MNVGHGNVMQGARAVTEPVRTVDGSPEPHEHNKQQQRLDASEVCKQPVTFPALPGRKKERQILLHRNMLESKDAKGALLSLWHDTQTHISTRRLTTRAA